MIGLKYGLSLPRFSRISAVFGRLGVIKIIIIYLGDEYWSALNTGIIL